MKEQEKSRVTCFGLGTAAVDFRIRTADLGEGYTEKLVAQHVDMLPGGAVANCLAQITRFGGSACWLGKLGEDRIGKCIVDALESDGIDTSAIVFDSACCSPFNLAAYAGHNRRRVGGWLLPNSLNAVTEQDMDRWLDRISDGDWLIAEIGEVPLETVLYLCERVSSHGAMVAIDVDLDPVIQCGADRNLIDSVFACADLLIPNRQAVAGLYEGLSANDLAEKMFSDYQIPVVVTAGEDGAWVCDSNGAFHQDAEPVEVVDTVGAGDAFHGGLVWSLCQGKTLKDAVEKAVACGAAACCVKGARPANT